MGSEREASLPIEDFGGVNLNADSEDIAPNQLLSAQNLWEKTLGVLETRGHSQTVLAKPSSVVNYKIGQIYKLYKTGTEVARFAPMQCTPSCEVLSVLPTGVTLSFHTNANGFWNTDHAYGGTTLSHLHRRIIVRFVGYGVDKFYEIAPTAITGYAATTQILRVSVANTFDNTSITGIEIYVTVASGSTETIAAITDVSSYQEQTMWVGHVNVASDSLLPWTQNFPGCPFGYDVSVAANTTIATDERGFSVNGYESGVNNISGTFVGGKTYYVAVLPQYAVFSAGTLSRMCYRNPTVDVFGGEVVPVTIPGATTGYISINSIAPFTQCYLVAIGDTPQTLQPHRVYNDSGSLHYDSSLPNQYSASGESFIESPPLNCPGVVDMHYTAEGLATLQFRFSDFSRKDMLVGINDDGTTYPIFCGRLHATVNSSGVWRDVVSEFAVAPTSVGLSVEATDFRWVWYSVNHMAQMQQMGIGSTYNFISHNYYSLFVNDYDPQALQVFAVGTSNYYPMEGRTGTNYWICDGKVAALVIEDYQASTITLPNMKMIAKFDSSIILGGGTPGVDPLTGLRNDSSKTLYFSRALNPFDFTIAGASSVTHQTISQDDDGEDITGFGIFTTTTSDSGPQSHLVTAKKNLLWILSSIPDVTSGVLDKATNRVLSKKVGGYHKTFANTPIGLIVAGNDNVYLLRDDGEPNPVGQGISKILKGANMTKAVAVYHDKHYKLSFSHADYSGYVSGHNNVEMWLNINKIIETKGGEDWVGPMIGRGVDSCFVEDHSGDGSTYNTASTRWCVDTYGGTAGTGRIFKADVAPAESDATVYDYGSFLGETYTPVTCILSSKDLDISKGDNNWNKILKRFYVKVRSNWTSAAANSATHTIYANGVSNSAVDFTSSIGNNAGNFSEKVLDLVGLFSATRLRGRTFRLVFTFTKRIAIGGFQINYQVERRRI